MEYDDLHRFEEALKQMSRALELIRGGLDRLDQIDERLDGLDSIEQEPSSPEWDTFLREHPELEREPLTFTDEELLAALDKATETYACGRNEKNTLGAAWSSHVAENLRPDASKADVARVVVGLKRLKARGVVTFLKPRHRSSGQWVRTERLGEVRKDVLEDCGPPVLPGLEPQDVYEALLAAVREQGGAVRFPAIYDQLDIKGKRTQRETARVSYALGRLVKAGMAKSEKDGPQRLWRATRGADNA